MLEFIYFAVLNGNSSPPCLKARKESSCHKDKLLIECKATVRIQDKQIELLNRKLSLVEERLYRKNRVSVNYVGMGSRHNRDIGTMKRRNRKSYRQKAG